MRAYRRLHVRLPQRHGDKLDNILGGGIQPVRVVLRVLALSQLHLGKAASEVAANVRLTSKAVREIGRRYQDTGLDCALYDGQRPGRRRRRPAHVAAGKNRLQLLETLVGRLGVRLFRAAGRALHGHGDTPPVERGGDQGDKARIAVAPDGDPVVADIGSRVQVAHGVAIAARLNPRIDLLARLAATAAEIAMIVKQHGQAGLPEDFRIAVKRHGDGRGRTMGHYDGGKRRGPLGTIESAEQQRAFGRELDGLEHRAALQLRAPKAENYRAFAAVTTPASARGRWSVEVQWSNLSRSGAATTARTRKKGVGIVLIIAYPVDSICLRSIWLKVCRFGKARIRFAGIENRVTILWPMVIESGFTITIRGFPSRTARVDRNTEEKYKSEDGKE